MRAYVLIWLVYLVFPLLELWAGGISWPARLIGLAGLAVFVMVYVVAWSGDSWRDPRLPWLLSAAFAIAVGLIARFGGNFTGLLIFVAALSARLSSFRVAIAAAAIDTAACVAANLAVHAGAANTVAIAGICGMTGMVSLVMRRLSATRGDLHAAREEIARLAAVDERLRIARDMHDLLGHSLAVIALKAELAERLLATDQERAAREVAEVRDVARRSLAEIRAAVAGYRRPRLAEELARARQGLAAAGIACDYGPPPEGMPGAVEAVLAWVIREGATNALKHSGARYCAIAFTGQAGQLGVVVEDDGRGPAGGGAGSGLAGLTERVRAAGGDLRIGPSRLGGFRLEAWVAAGAAAGTQAGASGWLRPDADV